MNRLLYYSLSFYLCLTSRTALAASKDTKAPEPCTIRSPTSHAFFDLNPLHIEDPTLSKAKNPRDHGWNTTGWGLNYNFTMNFCGPVIEDLDEVVGVEKGLWGNVSAYYKQGGKVYSIG
jgi:cation-dependent mannose-6-phosphate receptor